MSNPLIQCPRCGRLCEPAGSLTAEGLPADVVIYQCETCVDQVDGVDAAFTFGMNAGGQVLDVTTPAPDDGARAPA